MAHLRSILLVTAAILAVSPALAEPVGVMERPRPEYDAKGIDLGSFRLKPSFDVGAVYDTNVYRTQTGKKSDVYYDLGFGFSLKNETEKDMVELYGRIDRQQYNVLDKENRTDWNAGIASRLGFWGRSSLESDASYTLTHEPRYSPDDSGGLHPTEFAILHSGLKFNWNPSAFGFSVGYDVDRFDYHSTKLLGGLQLNNNDRDQIRQKAVATLSYEFGPDYAVFLRGAYDMRNFRFSSDRNGYNRDSTGWRAEAGAMFFITNLLKGEIFGGYQDRSFKSTSGLPYTDLHGIDYGASLHWYMTELMTVHMTASRTYNDTTLLGASATDDQKAGLSLDWEILRNLILRPHVDYTNSDFIGLNRTDRILDTGFELRWLVNEYVSLRLAYDFAKRSSNAPGQDFTDHLVSADLHFQL